MIHYLSSAKLRDTIDDILFLLEPSVTGLQLRYSWRELEPSRGVYNFDHIKNDLRILSSRGKKLNVMLMDKSFTSARFTPDYIPTFLSPEGSCAKRWDPFVVLHFRSLLEALARAVPGIDVSTEESSLGQFLLGDPVTSDYTPEAYANSLIEVCSFGRTLFPRFFWYANFIKGNNSLLYNIAKFVAPLGVYIGGPDVTPESDGHIKVVTPFYEWLAKTYPRGSRFSSFQRNSYKHERPNGVYWTMAELYTFAVTHYDPDTMFWNIKEDAKLRDVNGTLEYVTRDALRVINNSPLPPSGLKVT
jgi:hypothetical protein